MMNFKCANYIGINVNIYSINWNDILCDVEVDIVCDRFYSIMQHCLEIFLPLKRIISSHFPVRFSPKLKDLVIRQKAAHKHNILI